MVLNTNSPARLFFMWTTTFSLMGLDVISIIWFGKRSLFKTVSVRSL
ncbi:hypothetical protein MGWOODY_XGa1609 [hydrothermal vent metagenome]|uniref:Uncharacterized protein n=1 Tax=hydrothermal vent metagenome TaxID=652676 RepID=A0A160TR36_9ZZZZ